MLVQEDKIFIFKYLLHVQILFSRTIISLSIFTSLSNEQFMSSWSRFVTFWYDVLNEDSDSYYFCVYIYIREYTKKCTFNTFIMFHLISVKGDNLHCFLFNVYVKQFIANSIASSSSLFTNFVIVIMQHWYFLKNYINTNTINRKENLDNMNKKDWKKYFW